MRTFCFFLLAAVALSLLLWIVPAEPATTGQPFGWTAEWKTCLWCGRRLAKADPFFDTDRCGRFWAEQLAVRGLRVHAEEIVDVTGL